MVKQVQAADTAHAMQTYVEALAQVQQTGQEEGMGVTSIQPGAGKVVALGAGGGLLAGETAWQGLRRDGLTTADRVGMAAEQQYVVRYGHGDRYMRLTPSGCGYSGNRKQAHVFTEKEVTGRFGIGVLANGAGTVSGSWLRAEEV